MSSLISHPRPTAGEPRPWTYPQPMRSQLSNGLNVLVCSLPQLPMVAVSVLLDLAITEEPRELEGMCQLVASGLKEGTQRLAVADFAAELERHGTNLAAGAGRRALTANLDLPLSRLEGGLALLAEALSTPAFPEASIERLKKQRIDAIALESASAGTLADRSVDDLFFDTADRYSRPVGGSVATVSAVTRDLVADFYATHAAPSNATLVLVGDFSSVDLPALLERTLGTWSATGRSRAELERASLASAPVIRVIDRPGSVQTELRLVGRGYDRAAAEWTSSNLSAYVLGGPLTSRLSAKLREEKGYTYGINAGANPFARGGQLRISTSVETSVTGAAIAEIYEVTRAYAAGGAQDQEVVDAVTSRVAVAPLRLQGSRPLAGEVAQAVVDGLPDDFLARQLERVKAAKTADVSAAAARDWDLSTFSLVACGDGSVITAQIEALGLGAVEVVPADEVIS